MKQSVLPIIYAFCSLSIIYFFSINILPSIPSWTAEEWSSIIACSLLLIVLFSSKIISQTRKIKSLRNL
jgi:hypothetical protein